MKLIRSIGTTLFALVFSISLMAQSNTGIDMLRLGEYELATQFFKENMAQDKAQSLYYLGEIAWEEGKTSDAKAKYTEALSSNPESLYAQIGVAKADLKADPKEAKKTLENIYKKNKKDIPLVLEVAKAFFDNNMTEDADKAIAEAKKSNLKSPLIYILLGDVELKKGKTGDAAREYDQAIHFDNKHVLALIKAGKVYENINAGIASKYLKEAAEVDPSNRLVNRTLAKIYSTNGYHASAIKLYTDYFMEANFNVDDIRNFAVSLYFTQKYREAREILNIGIEREPDNFVFNRLLMYIANELKETDNGLKIADKFFNLRADQEKEGYIDKDYVTYGHLLAANDRTEEAMVAFNKAIELNPENAELYKDLSSAMYDDKMYEAAADFLQKYIDIAGDKADAGNFFQMGRAYQMAGTQLMSEKENQEVITKRNQLFTKADEAFAVLIEKNSNNYLGYYSRANVNAMLDPDFATDKAKQLYEKTLELIKESDELDKRKNIVQTVYEYLSYYYYFNYTKDEKNKELKASAIEYCNKTLELNPDKEQIKQVLEVLQQ